MMVDLPSRRLGKSYRQAIMVQNALNNGNTVYHWSIDPEKCGKIVEVDLPQEIKDALTRAKGE